jgi:hypothetical protein
LVWLKVDADGEQVGAEQARDRVVRSVQRPEGVGQPPGSGERIIVVEDACQPTVPAAAALHPHVRVALGLQT